MEEIFLVSSKVSGHPAVSCPCQSTYTSVLYLTAFLFLLHPFFVCIMRSPSFLLTLFLVVGQICKLLFFGRACNQHTDQRL
jgi:hypothetical protein